MLPQLPFFRFALTILQQDPMDYILAFDQGTTSSRSIIFDRAGDVVSASRSEFRQIFPRSGWVEHDPEEIFASQIEAAVEAREKRI